jgi:putative photosynthetic complex assembly protein
VLAVLAYLHARTTLYTITTQRVVMRIGVALPVTWNLPFKRLAAAQLAKHKDGSGDVVLELAAPDRVSFLQFWPHIQPGRMRNARPSLRALPDPQLVAAVLAGAVRPLPSELQAASLPLGAAASNMGQRPAQPSHLQTVPRALLWGAFGLMLGSIVLAAVSRKMSPPMAAVAPAQQVIELRFEDRTDGALAVLDGTTERELKLLAPGSNNFIRGVLRGMFRMRKLEAVARDVPFTLARDASGKLSLEDREVGRRVDLDSFGPDNSAAFRELLEAGAQGAVATRAGGNALASPVLIGVNGGQHGDYPRP